MSVILNDRRLYLAYEATLSGPLNAASPRLNESTGGVKPSRLVSAIAEAEAQKSGALDLIILDDAASDPIGAEASFRASYEPFTLGSFLASRTRHVGIALSASAALYHPFNLARLIASADHISHGRTALNLKSEDLPPQHLPEYIEVLRKLWDSWEDDVFLRDKATGQFVRPEKLHAIAHDGPAYKVQGPLNVARPPQGNPPVIASWNGLDTPLLAADILRIAPATSTLARKLRTRLENWPGHLLADVAVLLADRDTEGWARFEAASPISEDTLALLAKHIGVAPEILPSGALPEDTPGKLNEAGRTLWLIARHRLAQRRAALPQDTLATPTAADLLRAWQVPGLLAIGSAHTIAAQLRETVAEAGLDGVVFRPLGGLEQLHLLHSTLFPLLNDGPVAEDDTDTLQQRLHLPRPTSRYAHSSVKAAAHV